MIAWIFLGLVVAGLGYIRLAPSDPANWHVPVEAQSDRDFAGGALRVVPAGEQTLAKIDAAARALDRTRVLAGSVQQGRITYITRSLIFGFPDYTTVEQSDGQVRMLARLRFGRSDLGVNARRLEQLVAAAKG
ncbi:MAG: DUF1499 domain-containing protein [Pseudomonadota bacterium]